jgi:uncharacterized membrane protein YozB (DUF420 family)
MNFSQLFLVIGVVWATIGFFLLIVAWHAAASGNIRRHRFIMILSAVAAWLFIIGYLLRYRYGESIPQLPPEYIPWFALHGTVALFPFFGATFLVWGRLRERHKPAGQYHINRQHRKYGRVLIVLWCFTHLGGVVNFWLVR